MEADIDESLDVVSLLRRRRMHGFGLALLLGARELELIGESSSRKPLKDSKLLAGRSARRECERFSFGETILVHMMKRYRTAKKKLSLNIG